MALTPQQIIRFAEEIYGRWDLPTLTLFASGLNIDLNNLAPCGSVEQRARKFH